METKQNYKMPKIMNTENLSNEAEKPELNKDIVMARYFVPKTQLFHLTIGRKYLITHIKEGRQIKDDRGIERIVRPIPSEIEEYIR